MLSRVRHRRAQPTNVVAAAALCLIAALALAQPAADPPSNLAQADRAFQAGDYARAVDLYQAARRDGVDHSMLHFRLGYSLHVLGRVEEAIPHHLRGSRISNNAIRIDCLYNAACASALLHRPDDCLKYLQHAIDAGFVDVEQAANDADLHALRADPRFTQLIDSIGHTPTLPHQLDFLLGDWRMTTPDGQVIDFSFQRPLENCAALTYQSVPPMGGSLAGSIIPDWEQRTWDWTYAVGFGTISRFTGVVNGQTVVWTGRHHEAGGVSGLLRITDSLEPDGRIKEAAEYSMDDGRTWETHHVGYLVRQ